MFTITNKLRTIIAIGAAGAALAGSGVASAATVVHTPGTGTAVVASHPTTVALDPSQWGSANDGYTNQDCEDLANAVDVDHNFFDGASASAEVASNPAEALQDETEAGYWAGQEMQDQQELTSNCFQILPE